MSLFLALSGIGATPDLSPQYAPQRDVGERNSDLLREVTFNGGRPMATADSF
jgi:hypothetical protein